MPTTICSFSVIFTSSKFSRTVFGAGLAATLRPASNPLNATPDRFDDPVRTTEPALHDAAAAEVTVCACNPSSVSATFRFSTDAVELTVLLSRVL